MENNAVLKAVYIQTRNDCNGHCTICPQDKAFAFHGFQEMSSELFKKIINDLKDYEGKIGLFLQYEPLLDGRIFDFIAYAKKNTRAEIEVSTNGILLEEHLNDLLKAPIDILYLNYGATLYGMSVDPKPETLRKLAKHTKLVINVPELKDAHLPEWFKEFRVSVFNASNRAGNIDFKQKGYSKFAERRCVDTLNIVANGDIILCCNDYMRTQIFGNAQTMNIVDIYNKIPKTTDFEICKNCQ